MIQITPFGEHCDLVQGDDIERAEAAAAAVLAQAGLTPQAAFAAYREQWSLQDGETLMAGPARTWIEARQAADVALTATWQRPGKVLCEISA